IRTLGPAGCNGGSSPPPSSASRPRENGPRVAVRGADGSKLASSRGESNEGLSAARAFREPVDYPRSSAHPCVSNGSAGERLYIVGNILGPRQARTTEV